MKQTALHYLATDKTMFFEYVRNSVSKDFASELDALIFAPENELIAFLDRAYAGANTSKTKLLMVTSNPANKTQIDVNSEAIEIQAMLQENDSIDFTICHNATFSKFANIVKNEKPNILHFSMHGSENGLLFQNDTKQAKQASALDISNIFKYFELNSITFDLVVLNACQTENIASKIKSALYVIYTTTDIKDAHAIAFSKAFYESIAKEKSNIQGAFEIAKIMAIHEGANENDFCIMKYATKNNYV